MTLRPFDAAQFAAHEAGELPAALPLGEGRWAFALPLPVGPPAYTLVYAFPDAAANVHLLDTGWDLPGSLELLSHGLSSVGLSLDRVESVTATHLHSDHLGLAARIREASGARVQVHSAEQRGLDEFAQRGVTVPDLSAWGVPEQLHESIAAIVGHTRPVELTADVMLEHGQRLDIPGRDVRVLHTPGHTAGSICLVEGDVVFTGDLVLPTIFPGVGLGGDSADPLADYLHSLDLVEALGDPLVAPGHGYVFRNLAERVGASREHQLARTREVESIQARRPDATVWEVASQVTWTGGWASLSGFHQASALSQTAMRMRYVEHQH
ncbi:MAG: MBL fold metallo-hydrolase [Salinibacterium sp.]|nr:MBL fold metallo-hydrolase [Salinibacterium sp.]